MSLFPDVMVPSLAAYGKGLSFVHLNFMSAMLSVLLKKIVSGSLSSSSRSDKTQPQVLGKPGYSKTIGVFFLFS